MSQSKLHVIGTPLGNRDDITLRALHQLRELGVFFAEDTRELKKLMDMHGISHEGKRLYSHGNHNLKESTETALELLSQGTSIGFVSDRGTPVVSDPGAMLVARALKLGISVVPIPGPSAVTTLLSVCGFSGDRFSFLGFLPREPKDRVELWNSVEQMGHTTLFFESARRLPDVFSELVERFPNGRFAYGREMTKVFEEYRMGAFADPPPELDSRGEYTFAFDPGPKRPPLSDEENWKGEVARRLQPDRAWAKWCSAKYGVSTNEVYRWIQSQKAERDALQDE